MSAEAVLAVGLPEAGVKSFVLPDSVVLSQCSNPTGNLNDFCIALYSVIHKATKKQNTRLLLWHAHTCRTNITYLFFPPSEEKINNPQDSIMTCTHLCGMKPT